MTEIDWTTACPPERRCADRHNLCPAACHEVVVMEELTPRSDECSCRGGPHGGYTCEACR